MTGLSNLSILPIAPWPILILLAALGLLLVWWPAGPRERTETAATQVRRSLLVTLLFLAALRPALPGTDVRVDADAVDVYFVVDTTTSVMARDYGGGQPRIQGVRADIKGIAEQLSGARFSVLTFDQETTTRLPLTSDEGAVDAAADTLRPETSTWSRGSTVTLARDALTDVLQRGRASHSDRVRLVFYLGDGEQTAAEPPPPFAVPDELINGGAVLGYGTAAGGPMAKTGTLEPGDVTVPSTGRPALSVIDEKELNAIANQLGVPYLHRTADDGASAIVDAVRLKDLAPLRESDAQQDVGGRTEFYWIALLAVALLAAWEIGSLLASAAALGSRGLRNGRRRMPGFGRGRTAGWPSSRLRSSDAGSTANERQPEPTLSGGRR